MTLDPRRLDEWLAVPPEQLAERSTVPFVLVESREELHGRFAHDVLRRDREPRAPPARSLADLAARSHGPVPDPGAPDQRRRACPRPRHVLRHGRMARLAGAPAAARAPVQPRGRVPPRVPRSRRSRPAPATGERDLPVAARARPVGRGDGPPRARRRDVRRRRLSGPHRVQRAAGVALGRGHASTSCGARARAIVPLAVDTIIAHAQRRAGGNCSRCHRCRSRSACGSCSGPTLRLYLDTGSWKQTILRILLFSEPTSTIPRRSLRDHPDVHVMADRIGRRPSLPATRRAGDASSRCVRSRGRSSSSARTSRASCSRSTRFRREGESVLGRGFEEPEDGGKATNQAVAAAKLGAPRPRS